MGERPETVTVASECSAGIEGADALVDRKFHVGMQQYLERLRRPMRVLVPRADRNNLSESLEHERMPMSELPYELIALDCDSSRQALPSEASKIDEAVRSSALIYGHFPSAFHAARRHGVPYIFVVEHDVRNALAVARISAPDPARAITRQARALARFASYLEVIRGARSLHCNGYAAYDGLAWLQSNRMLYFDSRLTSEMLVEEGVLEERLSSLASGRPLNLLYSGRFERIKGVMDVVDAGIMLAELGIAFELHLYGDGSLREAMRYRIARHPAARQRIHLHGAVPFEELQRRSQQADIFLLCHRQGDPSCTYLEAMGCGLPIVGFSNTMWKPLARDSEAGVVVGRRSIRELSDAVIRLASDVQGIASHARSARSFAAAHCFEEEFDRRSEDMLRVMASHPPP